MKSTIAATISEYVLNLYIYICLMAHNIFSDYKKQ